MSDTKKFSSAECLEALIEHIQANPKLIRMHVNTVVDAEHTFFESTMWPGVFEEDNWFRTSTHRPGKQAEDDSTANNPMAIMGNFGFGGTDKEVRTYDNELWSDNGKLLEGIVVTEFGEILEIIVNVKW